MNEKKIWDSYNSLINSDDTDRIQKILTRYNLFKKTNGIPGDIVECGVFKGTSFLLFCKFLLQLCFRYDLKLYIRNPFFLACRRLWHL